ncbi:MAG: glycoside hydrolase family 88 protein [Tannerella sp.]|jgi:rhamnogalacturonyl hydrolase YesR|nr:glycoside hydrolase family 88 protein [Tannerella sp.]
MKAFYSLILMLAACALSAQQKHPDPKQNIERLLRNVAGNIMQNTSYRIVDTETGKLYASSESLPVKSGYRPASPYNEWIYENGVLNIGFMALASQLRDATYSDYAKKNVSFAFDHDAFFKKLYDAKTGDTGMEQKYRLALLDDCGAMGAGVLAVYAIDAQKRYRAYLDSAAYYVMHKEKRLKDGTFSRIVPYDMTVWADDLYMSVPFLARMGALTGDVRYFDEAARQVILFNEHLWDERHELFYHAWYDDIGQNGVAHWGRCNGWVVMAQVELLAQLPADHPQRAELLQLFLRQIVGYSRYQDASGLWHQLLDKPDTYLETSVSAMFTYAIAKGVNEGWIDERYEYVAAQGWEGVAIRILADGQVEGICMGTGISTAVSYYANRPTPLNDIHGLGAILLAGSEMLKLYAKGIPFLW